MASLALIGDFDPRPRLGGRVLLSNENSNVGVITKINDHGKLLIQILEDNSEDKAPCRNDFDNIRKLPLTATLPSGMGLEFQLESFLRSDDAVRVSTSLFGLAAQDFRMDKERWKIVAESSDTINMALLRQQHPIQESNLSPDPDYSTFVERCLLLSSKIAINKRNYMPTSELCDLVAKKVEKVGKKCCTLQLSRNGSLTTIVSTQEKIVLEEP